MSVLNRRRIDAWRLSYNFVLAERMAKLRGAVEFEFAYAFASIHAFNECFFHIAAAHNGGSLRSVHCRMSRLPAMLQIRSA
jgi:hypothetical protein